MEKELDVLIKELFTENIIKVVLSNPKDTKFKKIVISKQECGYQAEKFTETQAFHENMKDSQLALFCYECMENGFKQLNAWDDTLEYSIKYQKKGRSSLINQRHLLQLKLKALTTGRNPIILKKVLLYLL